MENYTDVIIAVILASTIAALVGVMFFRINPPDDNP